MTGIIGSGFGLYGYLPTVLMGQEKVRLLYSSKIKFDTRPELSQYRNRIVWTKDIKEMLTQADTIIISVPPEHQLFLLEEIINSPAVKNIIIEKPIAPAPQDSINILERLFKASKNFRIGYIFLETEWFKELKNSIKKTSNPQLFITWKFKAHHHKNNDNLIWKAQHIKGGGVIRFFAIHFFALLAELLYLSVGNTQINMLQEDIITLLSHIRNKEQNEATLFIDSNSEEVFFDIELIEYGKVIFSYKSSSPMEQRESGDSSIDNRSVYLKKILDDLNDYKINDKLYKKYQQVNFLWTDIEKNMIADNNF